MSSCHERTAPCGLSLQGSLCTMGPRLAMAVAGLLLAGTALAQDFTGIGRSATPQEIRAWDIDVRADFKGLPKGSGSVDKGMEVWEGKCASCHGVFGESNEVLAPIVVGTTREDMKTGRVARLDDPSYPGRTTLMKLSQISTLWDYINRAMPWTQPKTLTVEEVYAVTAYILNLGDIVPADFVLSDENMAQVQAKLPNRKGMTTDHHLWPGTELGAKATRPDVVATLCMKDCPVASSVASTLPDHARDSHGNLAEQNRLIGPQRGAETTQPVGTRPDHGRMQQVVAPAPASAAADQDALKLAQQNACMACHGMDSRLVGPSFREITQRYRGKEDAVSYLAGKIKQGGQGVWGGIPMPAQALPESDAAKIAQWLAGVAAQ